MKLLIVSGFLGTGKTTFITDAARHAVEQNLKTAILVNEIGEIGIDDQYMKQLDLNVWEILGGCICCSLMGSLQSTLNTVTENYCPELVILEPSGAADLQSVNRVLSTMDTGMIVETIRVTLVDPLRMDMMMTVLTPLITSQVKSAEWVLINKKDIASDQEMKFARQTVRKLNPNAELLSISAKSGLDETLLDTLLRR